MTEIDRMVQISLKNADKIKKLCAPLSQQFPIRHFWCSMRRLEDGKFLCLGSNFALHEEYYHSKSYLHNPTFRSPDLIHSGFYLHQNYHEEDYSKTIHRYSVNFDAEFCAVCLAKTKKELITWGYAAKPTFAREFDALLVNNIPIFQQFNKYFLKETKKIFLNSQEYFTDVAGELGKVYHKKSPFISLSKETKGLFLSSFGAINHTDLEKLSAQELRCLRRIADGFSATQIADALELSARTVEHYLESIKNKLECDCKLELFQCASLLKSCGFFS